MLPDMALPQPPHNHILTPPIPSSGVTSHLHLPTSIESHLPEKLTHQKARCSSVQAYESNLAKAIATERRGDGDKAKLSEQEVAELKIELHRLEGMTEKEKEKWVAFKQTGEVEGRSGTGRKRSLATGY